MPHVCSSLSSLFYEVSLLRKFIDSYSNFGCLLINDCFLSQMMKTAWDGYVQYAFGQNELKPISKTGHSAGIFGGSSMGASIIDALDTLYIMGLTNEYKKGRDWVALSLEFTAVCFNCVYLLCLSIQEDYFR